MHHRRLPLLLAVASTLACGIVGSATPTRAASPARDTTLTVFAAASLREAFEAVAARVEQAHPGVVVRMQWAGSQQLAAQIEQGAQADVFASADQRWMDVVAEQGLLAEPARPFARNRLVVIVPKANPARIDSLRHLARTGVKLVIGADAVPVGRYSRTMLRRLASQPGFPPDFARRVLANVVSEEENVRGVVQKVQLGEADAGIVYVSDVTRATARQVLLLGIPGEANVVATYPVAVLRDARHPALAREFVDLLLSAEGQRLLEYHGFVGIATGLGIQRDLPMPEPTPHPIPTKPIER
jgi:molybdate transport system substrate-binding protein